LKLIQAKMYENVSQN